MNARIRFPFDPPDKEVLRLLERERAQEQQLRRTRVQLATALKRLSNERGLIVPLKPEDIRQELNMREASNAAAE